MAIEKSARSAILKPGASPTSGTVPPEEHRFKPGQSGNPAGRPPNLGQTIREELNAMGQWPIEQVERMASDPGSTMVQRIAATRLLGSLVDGDDFDRICDRTDGKPTQRVETTGDLPVAIRIITPLTEEQGS